MLIGTNIELVEIPYSYLKLLLRYKKRYEEIESTLFNDCINLDDVVDHLLSICLRDDVADKSIHTKKLDVNATKKATTSELDCVSNDEKED